MKTIELLMYTTTIVPYFKSKYIQCPSAAERRDACTCLSVSHHRYIFKFYMLSIYSMVIIDLCRMLQKLREQSMRSGQRPSFSKGL